MNRLSDANFTPAYDRTALRTGVVHLGLGAFHRAHQAPLFDALAAQGDMRWGIAGVAMRSPAVVEALAAQDGLYSLTERSAAPMQPKVIASLRGLLVAAQQPQRVVEAIAAADTQLVTLTVTEKGYLGTDPASPTGLIAAALAQRHARGLGPITILSCDNRSGNGPFTRSAVLDAGTAGGLGDAALRWIADEIAFPGSMVDRITPATTAEMIDQSSAALGLRDAAAVWTEPFWQWVIEDRFAAARPPLETLGVSMVADVEPWEQAKLRLLNGAHSTLAYAGLLRGHTFVHQAIADPELQALIAGVWDEAEAMLVPTVVDMPAYRAALLERFGNPALPHALIQIAADGSQKLPPRLLSTFAERNARGLQSPALSEAVAAWVKALVEIDGLADPELETLRTIARSGAPARDRVGRLLDVIAPAGPHDATIAQVVEALGAKDRA